MFGGHFEKFLLPLIAKPMYEYENLFDISIQDPSQIQSKLVAMDDDGNLCFDINAFFLVE